MNPQLSYVSYACGESGTEVCVSILRKSTLRRQMLDIRKAQQQPTERWKKDIAAAMPQWVNDHKQCSVAIKKGVGARSVRSWLSSAAAR